MDELTIRRAKTADMDAVLAFYTTMIDEMQGTDYDILWKHDQHPSHAFLRTSIEHNHLFMGIAEDDRIACALVVDHTRAPGYERVPWMVDAPLKEIGIVHSVATLPAYHGRGFASRLMSAAIEAAQEDGLRSLQLDTFVDNIRSHGLYEKLGFVNHGAHPIFYDDLGTVDLDMFEYVI